jgi:hypothetical protein
MTANHSLLGCEAVLARLEAALEFADMESMKAKAAEGRIETLLSRVRTRALGSGTITGISPHQAAYQSRIQRASAANDNPHINGGPFPLIALAQSIPFRATA